MDHWAGIEFFQFDNIIRARVPFFIVNLGVDFDSIYPMGKFPMERIHIRNREMPFSPTLPMNQITSSIQTERVDLQDPLVVICQDGSVSSSLAQKLMELGYKNTYFVRGGLDNLLLSRDSAET